MGSVLFCLLLFCWRNLSSHHVRISGFGLACMFWAYIALTIPRPRSRVFYYEVLEWSCSTLVGGCALYSWRFACVFLLLQFVYMSYVSFCYGWR
ncbi:uncharacterized protein ASPGLDRAFT_1388046 [Aspergillus glaucus CBS 516.65]|uniref:Uncharacterized protein n=1 Tax=Aspergillus glaucus CBS 516.65 TaxID=1160497 RepID=A0A1L9VPA4_ASPGL|nr:hypothetical protein ASPGLDRAFT_1388046 [Aspergillus glaucus CBS 516.65]OJJ85758.1 hypothetical protein ASPGLDRAFT_1388046 [Aspergillus glaucus CBS 516.65]